MTIDAADAPRGATKRPWLLWAGLIVLVWIAWRVIGLGQADALAEKNPDAALAWRGDQSEALLNRAQMRLAAGDIPGTEAAARQALVANPMDGLAYRLLADVALAHGDRQGALQRYELAVERAPRDLPGQGWLSAYYLRAGDYPRVLAHIDALLRVEPELEREIFPDLARLASLPAAQPALLRVLQRQPPWRADFLTQLSQHAADVRAVAPLMEQLRHGHGGLVDSEMSAWLDRLIRDRQWGAAYLTWVAQLPREKQQAIGNVFNGGFDWQPSNSGFGWRFSRIAGANIDRAETAGAKDTYALRVSFDNQRVPFNNVRQLLALAPGRYRLEGRARLDSLDTDLGLVWEVACAETGRALASSPPFLGNSPWNPFSFTFVVPENDCGGQWLQLRLPARIAAEQRIGGVAWFDDLKVTEIREP